MNQIYMLFLRIPTTTDRWAEAFFLPKIRRQTFAQAGSLLLCRIFREDLPYA